MEVDRTVDLFKQMPLEGLAPTIETFSPILQGYFYAGRVVEAQKFFQEMLTKGLKLNIVTCSIVLHGLCENHLVGEALSFFHKMECAGVLPNIYIYTILIDGLSKDGHLEKARSLFESLPSKGLRPNAKTYTVMIGAFCREGLLDEANELFAKMKDSNCLPDDATYNTLIRGSFYNKYSEASALIDEMRAHDISADASTTSLLLVLLGSKEQDPTLLALRLLPLTLSMTLRLRSLGGSIFDGLKIYLLASTSPDEKDWSTTTTKQIPDNQNQVKIAAGETLSMLALESKSNCHWILKLNVTEQLYQVLAAQVFRYMTSEESSSMLERARVQEAEFARALVQILKKNPYPPIKIPRM
ncbi:hypothetical protein AgCh_029121 [Apium graveolens]